MPKLASIHLYPIKSTAGMPLTRALVTEEGLQGDRRYMVVKPDGSFITARTHPQLQQVVATPIEGGLQLRYPGLDPSSCKSGSFPAPLGPPESGATASAPCRPSPRPISG